MPSEIFRATMTRLKPGRIFVPLALAILVAAWAPARAAGQTAPVPGEVVRVGSFEVLGLETVPGALPLPSLPLGPGARYTLPRLHATEHRIVRHLAELGYALASVEVVAELSPAQELAHLELRVQPGPLAVFGPIQVSVEPPLTEADVRDRLAYAPGDRFSPQALERSVELLHRLPIVEQVDLEPATVPVADSVLVTRMAVATGQVQGLDLEGALSSHRCLQGEVGWWNRYLAGAPRTLSLRLGGANLLAGPLRRFPCTGTGEEEFADPDYMLRADLNEPLRAGTWLLAGAEFSRLSAPQAYIQRGLQLRLGLARDWGRAIRGTATFSPQRRDSPASAPLLCAVYRVCEGPPLRAAVGARTHLPLEATLLWSPPPLQGIPGVTPAAPLWVQPVPLAWRTSLRASLVAAGTAAFSDFTYLGGTIETNLARSLRPGFELAGRTRLGFLADPGEPLPLHVRLYGGGILGVRGVEPNRLGPKVLTIARADLEALGCPAIEGGCEGISVSPERVLVRPTGGEALAEVSLEGRVVTLDWLQLAGFVDYGVVRSGAVAGAPAERQRSEGILTPGIGVLALTPLGPLRLDLAYNPGLPRRYPLLTAGADRPDQIFLGQVLFDPFTFDEPSGLREFRRRLQFQLSMGQPF